MKRTEFLVMINFDVVKYAVEARKTISYRTNQYDRYISYRYVNRNKNVGVLLQLKYRSYRTYFSRTEIGRASCRERV